MNAIAAWPAGLPLGRINAADRPDSGVVRQGVGHVENERSTPRRSSIWACWRMTNSSSLSVVAQVRLAPPVERLSGGRSADSGGIGGQRASSCRAIAAVRPEPDEVEDADELPRSRRPALRGVRQRASQGIGRHPRVAAKIAGSGSVRLPGA